MSHTLTIDTLQLSATTRMWIYNASEEELAKVMEIGFQIYHSANREKINSEIVVENTNEIKTMINNQNAIINETKSKVDNQVGELLHMMDIVNNKQAVSAGQEGEDFAFETLSKSFNNVRDMHDKPKMGDYHVNGNVLVEVKNYSNTVPKKEVEKFKRDLETSGMKAGVFWSLNTRIAGIGDYRFMETTVAGVAIPVIYIQTRDPKLITLAIELVSSKLQSNEAKATDITTIATKIAELDQNLSTVLNIRNTIRTMSDNIDKSVNSLNVQLTTLEATTTANMTVIKSLLNNTN